MDRERLISIANKSFVDSLLVKSDFIGYGIEKVVEAAERIFRSLLNGGKLIIFGNGGSAADAQHIAAEFVWRFQKERGRLPAIALTTDTSVITAIANDLSFEAIFSTQIDAIADLWDVCLAISTSGYSKNVVAGAYMANGLGIPVIALTGKVPNKLSEVADITISVNSDVTARIQETHITILHTLCELIDTMKLGT